MKMLKISQFFIVLAITLISLQLLNSAYAESTSLDEIIGTVKIIFSKNETGELTALIIPYTSDGHYPKSGWIYCETIAADVSKTYFEKFRVLEKVEDYFIATYRKIEKDKSISILRYKGELIKIEPWNPDFIMK